MGGGTGGGMERRRPRLPSNATWDVTSASDHPTSVTHVLLFFGFPWWWSTELHIHRGFRTLRMFYS